MDEVEVRCVACARRHPRRTPPLLAVLRGGQILEPARLESVKARELGVARGGLFWRKALVNPDGEAVLRCRRCGRVRLVRIEQAQDLVRRALGG